MTKIFYQSLTKRFSYRNSSLDNLKVLLLVSAAGVAAVSIDGTTSHSALYIAVGYFGRNLRDLSNKMKSSLKDKYSELKVLIDETSMISNDFLFDIHLRLVKMFGCQGNETFAGLTVITSNCNNTIQTNLYALWRY